MKNEIAQNDMDFLESLNADANRFNPTPDRARIPTLKISSSDFCPDVKSKYVVNQEFEKDKATGNVIKPIFDGTVVNKLIILAMKQRYSRFVNGQPNQNCNSPYFLMHEIWDGLKVRGSNFKNICGKTCEFYKKYPGNEDMQNLCKIEWVAFGIAIDGEGNEIPCIAHMGGTKYMPFQEYTNTAVKYNANGKNMKLPLFAFETNLLTPIKGQHQGKVFDIPVFGRGNVFAINDRERFDKYKKMAEQTIQQIEAMNSEMSDGPKSVLQTEIMIEDGGKMDELPFNEPYVDNAVGKVIDVSDSNVKLAKDINDLIN